MSIGTHVVKQNPAVSNSKFSRVWNTLTEPSAKVAQPEQRSQARLLATVTLILAMIVTASLVVFEFLSADFLFALCVVTLIGLFTAYVLSRSGYAQFGTILLLAVSILIPVAGFLADPTQAYILVILVNSTALSGLFFSARVTSVVVAGEIIMLMTLALIRPEFTPLHFSLLIFFLLTESLFIVLITHVRQQHGAQDTQARAIVDSEARFRAAAEASMDAFYLFQSERDETGTITDFIFVSVNARALQFINMTNEQVIGRRLCELLPINRTDGFFDKYVKVVETGVPLKEEFSIQVGDDNHVIWLQHQVVPVLDGIAITTRNITELNQVEANLRQTNLRLEASRDAQQRLIQQMPIGVQVFDPNGLCADVNQTYMEIFGVDNREQVVGKFNILENLPNNPIGQAIKAAFRRALQGEMVHVGESEQDFSLSDRRFSSRTGRLTLAVDFCPIYDENQQIINIVALNQDITERKQIEANLRQTNLRLEASSDTLQRLIEQMPIGIQMFDTNGLCTSINETHMTIFGLTSREQVVGKFNILTDQLAQVIGTQDGYKRALAGEVAYVGEVEFDFRHADPRFTAAAGQHFLSVSFFPIYDENHAIVSVVALNQDITERKLAERALEQLADELLQQKNTLNAILSATPDQLAIFDREGRYLYVNPPGLAVIGVDMETAQNKSWSELPVPVEIGERFEQIRAQVITTRQPFSGTVSYPLKDSVREFEFTLSPIVDAEGQVALLASTTRDVTEQREAEQERFALALERERVKMLQHLISDTSHDLKTPLATLNTSLYLLKKTISDPERREHYTEVLQAQVVNLTKILEDMDSMARLDGASDQFVFEPVDLNELLRQIVIEHEALASKKSQRLVFHAGDALPPLLIDATKLRRAITNLVTNALNYTPEGGDIAASLYREENSAIIEIRDNGRGIAPDELPNIFDRFYRSEESRKHYSEGSGLGLAITQKIVDGHGGAIQVESTIGKGSTFRIILPIPSA